MEIQIDPATLQLEQLVQIMNAFLSGENARVKEATKYLKRYIKYKQSIRLLSFILQNTPEMPLRQLATVLLNKNVINLYSGLNQAQQLQFRTLILVQFNKEDSLGVQKGICKLISQLLMLVKLPNWPQLQQLFVHTLSNTPQSPTSLVLLESLICDEFQPTPEILQYLFKCLKIPKLVDYAFKCLTAIVQLTDLHNDEITRVLVTGWQSKLFDQSQAQTLVNIFSSIAEKKNSTISPQVIVWMCKKIILDKNLPEKLRTSGLDFLYSVTFQQVKLLNRNTDLLREVVHTVSMVCSQPPKPDREEDIEYIQEIALYLIQTLASSVQSKKIYPIMMDQIITPLINSNDPNLMNTGFLVMAGLSDGCSERMRRSLGNPIMSTLIPKGLNHPSPEVKGAAISALSYFSQYLLPDIVDYHSVVIPSLLNSLNDLELMVAEKALMGLDLFTQNLEPQHITQYLNIIVPRLIQILADGKSTNLMKKASLSTLSSVVVAAESSFQPYLQQVCPMIKQYNQMSFTPQTSNIRAQVITLQAQLIHHFCKSGSPIQKEYFNQMVIPYMEGMYGILLNQQDHQVRQSSFCFFYLLAGAIGGEFSVIFDKVVPEVMKQAQRTHQQVHQQKQNEISMGDESEGQTKIEFQITELDQKAAAIQAMGEFAKSCPIKFLPYFPRAYAVLQANYKHFYDNIRLQVLRCYDNLTRAVVMAKNNGVLPTYKQGLPCFQRYPQQLQTHFETELIPMFIYMMTKDESVEVQAYAIEALDSLVKALGPALIDKSINKIVNAVLKLLDKKNASDDQDEDQTETEDEDEQQDDQTEVHTFEPLCDFIPRLCKVLRDGFEPSIKQLIPSMMKYTEDRQNYNDYIQILGSFVQVFKYIPSTIAMVQDQLAPKFQQFAQLGDELLNRNIVYCMGVMFQYSPKSMQPGLQGGLALIKDIYDKCTVPATKQNAISAICRIIYTYNPPLPLELFIQNTLKSMPFVGDPPEQKVIHKTFIYLANNHGQLLKPHLSTITNLLRNYLSNPTIYRHKQHQLPAFKQFYAKLSALCGA